MKLTEFKQLDNKTILSFPIKIGVLRSKQRLNFWQSQASNYSLLNVSTMVYLVQFIIFYFLLDNKPIALIWIVFIIAFFFVRKSEMEKSNAIFEPNRFYKEEIDYHYDDILMIYEDKIECLAYFKKQQGTIYFNDIKEIRTNYMRGSQGIECKLTKQKRQALKKQGKRINWFNSQNLTILNNKLVLNEQYLTNLAELGNLIIHAQLQKQPITYLTHTKGFPQEHFKSSTNDFN